MVGNVIFVNQHSLCTSKADNFSNSQILAGALYAGDTIGQNARFKWPNSFLLITRSDVIISDTNNHCLKLLNRTNGITKVLAGQCSSSGYQDGTEAKFNSPWAILPDNQNSSQLLLSENDNYAIRTVDVCDGNWSVGTFVKSNLLRFVRQMIQHQPIVLFTE